MPISGAGPDLSGSASSLDFRNHYDQLIKNLESEYFFYRLNNTGKIVWVSPSVEKMLGYGPEEYAKVREEIYTKNEINTQINCLQSTDTLAAYPKVYTIEVFNKQCKTHILQIQESVQMNKFGEIDFIDATVHDISAHYYGEVLMHEQEEKYRQIFESASDFIFIYELDKDGKPGKFIETNRYTRDILGYSDAELLQKSPEDLLAAEIWNEKHKRKISEVYEQIWETKSGMILNVEISEHQYTHKNKNYCIAVARNISERKKALEEIKFMNEELINQKENLEALIDNLTQTQEQLVQSEKMAALGQLIAGVAHEINTPLGAIKASVGNLDDSLKSALVNLPALFREKSEVKLNLFIRTFELARIQKPEISSREKREYKRKIRSELKEQGIEPSEILADLLGYLEIYDNASELFPMLREADSVQVLNNVRDFISLLKNTRTISIASDKASTVVFALKKYAHRDSLGEKVPTDIADGIETVLTLYENQFKQGITVVKDFSALPMAMCYQDEINQVWTNIIQNALHAMKLKGTLTIKATSADRMIEVSISDTGEGIEPTIIDKIFDPFFTTKKQGEGSGMGLDIVRKIIDKHNGYVDVKSKLGEGTTFTVQIPIA